MSPQVQASAYAVPRAIGNEMDNLDRAFPGSSMLTATATVAAEPATSTPMGAAPCLTADGSTPATGDAGASGPATSWVCCVAAATQLLGEPQYTQQNASEPRFSQSMGNAPHFNRPTASDPEFNGMVTNDGVFSGLASSEPVAEPVFTQPSGEAPKAHGASCTQPAAAETLYDPTVNELLFNEPTGRVLPQQPPVPSGGMGVSMNYGRTPSDSEVSSEGTMTACST